MKQNLLDKRLNAKTIRSLFNIILFLGVTLLISCSYGSIRLINTIYKNSKNPIYFGTQITRKLSYSDILKKDEKRIIIAPELDQHEGSSFSGKDDIRTMLENATKEGFVILHCIKDERHISLGGAVTETGKQQYGITFLKKIWKLTNENHF